MQGLNVELQETFRAPPKNRESAFEEDLQSLLDLPLPPIPNIPILPKSAFCSALANLKSEVVWLDERFETKIGKAAIEPTILESVLFTKKPRISYTIDANENPTILIYAPLNLAQNWHINVPSATICDAVNANVIITAISLGDNDEGVLAIAKAFNMTGLEAKICANLVSTGNLKIAALKSSVTYLTAKSALKSALKKTECTKQAQLIAKLSQIVALTNFNRATAIETFMDVFALSHKQAQLALLVTQGYTRDEAANLCGISIHAAKTEFEKIFANLCVKNTNEVARILNEAIVACLLVDCTEIELPHLPDSYEPLQFISRGGGEFIAISDYGPKAAMPIIFIHGSGTTRQIPRSLVRELQGQNYRPIAIDRPGFGLTDNCSGEADAFEAGAHDMAAVCEKLGLERVDLFARGGAQIALRFAHLYPHLLGKVAVICPSNQSGDSAKMPGPLGIVMRKIFHNPDKIEAIAKWLGSYCTPNSMKYLLRWALRSSPPDMKIFEDPAELEDYQRSTMMFITGRTEGFANEHRLYNKTLSPKPLADASNWIVFIGSYDPLQNPKATIPFWLPILPNARFITYDDGGHFIHISHANKILTEFAKIKI